ncbi:hypothetical protein IJ670_00120 [bacterium]|nr:hypothetical protein [bacterium]
MGLAASQARFLGLTARKSNIEYQGQQINQARTALSNEVMGLYQKYNNLKVPVAPSVYDYVKTTYTIDSTAENYQITDYSKITTEPWQGYYNVSLKYNQEIAQKYDYMAKNITLKTQKNGDDYSYINFLIGANNYIYDANDTSTSNITKIDDNYELYSGLSVIMEALGVKDGTFYMMTINNQPYYTSKTDLDETAYDDEHTYIGDYTLYYQGTKKEEKTATAIASLDSVESGRLSQISVVESEDAQDLVGHTYSITTKSEQDQDAYQDAMNEYNYKKAIYEKRTEEINKQTEKIQAEDKALELKLNQLDTEQNAIATEMDSVSKVIEDTIDSVFKTYNS